MTLWDGLETDDGDPTSNRILIIGATNRVQDLDAAILRRMPTRYRIPRPSSAQRLKIFQLILKDEQIDDDLDLEKLARETGDFTGSDINEICRQAAMQRIVELCNDDATASQEEGDLLRTLRPIKQADFLLALEKVRQSHQHQHQNPLNQIMLD